MSKTRHLIGISGGKDSAALAIFLKDKCPDLDVTYYFCDTGKELDETYNLINSLEIYLGQKVVHLTPEDAKKRDENPFDHFYKAYNGYLPSSVARWCTKQMKLDPFEKFVGNDPVVSYVGIRGDEDREGYISKKPNIQSIFPFRKNIWSEDVVKKLLAEKNRERLLDIYANHLSGKNLDKVTKIINQPLILEERNPQQNRRVLLEKQSLMLDRGIAIYNHVTFDWLKDTTYPLAKEENFALLDNEDNLVREDIFKMLRNSGVGVPEYYEKIDFEVNGQKGQYSRSRSGCYFCFFQQKIEWVWLYEQHPGLFAKAQVYEKIDEGFTWNQSESLEDLKDPRRIEQIKLDYIKKTNRAKDYAKNNSNKLLDIVDDNATDCIACFT